MTQSAFFQGIRDALLIGEDQPLSMDTDLRALEEFDSFGAMNLIMFIDENFDCTLSTTELKSIGTIRSLALLVGEENITLT